MKTQNKSAQITVQKIPAAQTYLIRQEVLRKGKPIASCFFDADEAAESFHLGAFFNKKIVGVVSFLKNKNSCFPEENQFQLRGMAVTPDFQKQKIGEKLLLAGEKQLMQLEKPFLLWFNAREAAKTFYLQYEYAVKGPAFEIKDVGTHFLMFKSI